MILALLSLLAHAIPADPCGESPMWTVPADGDLGVPIDVVPRIASNPECAVGAQLFLDADFSESVPSSGVSHGVITFDVGLLEPDTAYVYTFSTDWGVEQRVRFSTSTLRSLTPFAPTVSIETITAYGLKGGSARVDQVLSATLEETGAAHTARFETEGAVVVSPSVLGRVRALLRPVVDEPEDLQCIQVVAIAPDLSESPATEVCPDLDEIVFIRRRACATSPGSASWALLLLPLVLRRRRAP